MPLLRRKQVFRVSFDPPSAKAAVIASALARHAVYDCDKNVWAYELRHVEPEGPTLSDGTNAVILSAFAEFGLERVVGSKRAFLRTSATTLGQAQQLPNLPQRVVLQVSEYQRRAEFCKDSFQCWKDKGFDIALDDFRLTPEVEPLLEVVDYAKIDVTKLDVIELERLITRLQKSYVEPIAVNVNSEEQFRRCEALGFISFQGEFVFQPQVLRKKALPSNFVIVSDLLARLQDPQVSIQQIEELVKRDAALSVGVLRFLNSSAYMFRHEVSSVAQAISLLGVNEFAKWALLVMMSARFDKPTEILTTALIRARCCENFARRKGSVPPATAFIVGLLSVLDAMLDQRLEEILNELPVSPIVQSAILDFDGPAGQLLQAVVTRENTLPELSGEDQQHLTEAWLDAVHWADRTKL